MSSGEDYNANIWIVTFVTSVILLNVAVICCTAFYGKSLSIVPSDSLRCLTWHGERDVPKRHKET